MTRTLCHKCGKKCYGSVLKVSGKFYHKGCFQCEACGKNLENEGYFELNGKLLCRLDYRKQSGYDCRTCGELIEGEAVSALGCNFHHQCFFCHTCQKPFHVSEKATLFQGHFYCQICSPKQINGFSCKDDSRPPRPDHIPSKTTLDKEDQPCDDIKNDSLTPIAQQPSPFEHTKKISSYSYQSKPSVGDNLRWSVESPYLANSTTDVSGYRSGRPTKGNRSTFQFGQHLNRSYLQLPDSLAQPRLRRSMSPGINRPVSPHFHVPTESNNCSKILTTSNSRTSTLNSYKGKPNLLNSPTYGPYNSLPRLTAYSSLHFRSTKTLFPDSRLSNGYSKLESQKCISDFTTKDNGVATEDPDRTAKEAKYLSMFPSACRPSSEYDRSLQPVEKTDWPGPPDPSVVLRDKNKYKSHPPPVTAKPTQPGQNVNAPCIRSSATITLSDKKEYVARREALRQSKMAHFARSPSPTYSTLNREGRVRDREEDESTVDTFMDCVTSLSDQNDSDEEDLSHIACTSTSCYEDARSVLTGSVDILATSSMAKAIRMEQAREQSLVQSVESLTAYVVSASRTPNADQEPKTRPRYDRHDAASPSRDTLHPSRIICQSKLQSMEYVNSGNRYLSLGSSRGTLNQPPVNSLASVLQSYEEMRPQYVSDLLRDASQEGYLDGEPQSAPTNSLQAHLTVYPFQDAISHHRVSYNGPYYTSLNRNNSRSSALVDGRGTTLEHKGASFAYGTYAFRDGVDSLKHSSEYLQSCMGMDPNQDRWKQAVSNKTSTLNSISTYLSMVRPKGDELTINYPYKYTSSRSRGISSSGGAPNDWNESESPRCYVSHTLPRDTTNSSKSITNGKDTASPQNNQDFNYRGLRPVHHDSSAISTSWKFRGVRARSTDRTGWRSSASTISISDKTIPYDDLVKMKNNSPRDVDGDCLEMYLSEEDFYIVFNMSRDTFYQLPKWRQNDLKRRVDLF